MKILCVIPSRIGSTRLPRKPLALIGDKPMLQMTYEGAIKCKKLDKVVVATDSEEIATVVRDCGGDVEMTDPNYKTGTDRVAAVAKKYPEMDVVVNLQGDEPFIKPHMLTALVQPYIDGETPEMSTLAYPLKSDEEQQNPGVVKVIYDNNGYAIYFSRSPLPYFRQQVTNAPVLHHMGCYAFQRDFLLRYTQLPQTPLELAESLEQLRVLENGFKIKICKINEGTFEINLPEELEEARKLVGL